MSSVKEITQVSHDAAESIKNILPWETLPKWMQSDPYIRRGYRRQYNNFSACLKSLFYLHNETVNIWSHLLPTLGYFLALIGTDYSILTTGVKISAADGAAIQLYVVASVFCLLFSAWFHTVAAHSEQVASRFLKLDYLGILLNVAACAITFIYTGLYGHPTLQAFHISLFTICATVVLSVMSGPLADGPKAAGWRALLFIALAASGWAPVAHMAFISGLPGVQNFPTQEWGAMAMFYLAGVIVYVTRVPERYFPGTFDIWGASHQIFHILVPFGQVVYFWGLRDKLLSHYG